jgi:hypothetical protein
MDLPAAAPQIPHETKHAGRLPPPDKYYVRLTILQVVLMVSHKAIVGAFVADAQVQQAQPVQLAQL